MGKYYDALRKKCPCQYCQVEVARNDWVPGHKTCVTPSPMEAYEAAAEKNIELQENLNLSRALVKKYFRRMS